MKILEKDEAIKLRKRGYSMGEISRVLKVSKGTVSRWVSGIELSISSQKILNSKITDGQKEVVKLNKEKTRLKEQEAKNFAIDNSKKYFLSIENERLMCSIIYWCEGSKSDMDSVCLTNSDPFLLRKFIFLLRKSFTLDESKFRVCVHLHNYHNKDKQLKFWSKTLRIPIHQFIKPYIKSTSGLYKKDGYQGCVSLRYHDVGLTRKLLALARNFIEKGD